MQECSGNGGNVIRFFQFLEWDHPFSQHLQHQRKLALEFPIPSDVFAFMVFFMGRYGYNLHISLIICRTLIPPVRSYGGFHSHGGTPINGWFVMDNPI